MGPARQIGYRRRRAFTLIELLLVVVIIAILAAVVLPKLTGRREQAQHSAALQDMSNIKTALGTFEIDNGRFPTTEEGLGALVSNPGNLPDWKGYLEKMPVDPWSHPYVYRLDATEGSAQPYELYCCGPSGQDQQGGGDNIKP